MNPQPLTRTASTMPLVAFALVAAITLSASSASAAVLFADNFNRADSTDLNAATTGKSGSLGALDWVKKTSSGLVYIANNQLRIGETGAGGGFGVAYVNHNFTDASIVTAGEFTVSVDIANDASGGNTRFNGFAVGSSSTELNGWSSSTPSAFPSDFFFGYDPTGTTEVKVFLGGTQDYQQTINLSSGGTLSVRFFGITDFNAGSTVNYQAFINGGSPVKTGSFTWSGTNENYIALYSNYTGNNPTPTTKGIQDNFSVSIPDPQIPTPAALPAGLAMLGLVAARRRRMN